jgi:hypothetical protein
MIENNYESRIYDMNDASSQAGITTESNPESHKVFNVKYSYL